MEVYTKKPVNIIAMQFTGDNFDEAVEFIGRANWDSDRDTGEGLFIETLEGTMLAREGDYIIRGVKGEFYSCREDIFLETYSHNPNLQPVRVRSGKYEIRGTGLLEE